MKQLLHAMAVKILCTDKCEQATDLAVYTRRWLHQMWMRLTSDNHNEMRKPFELSSHDSLDIKYEIVSHSWLNGSYSHLTFEPNSNKAT